MMSASASRIRSASAFAIPCAIAQSLPPQPGGRGLPSRTNNWGDKEEEKKKESPPPLAGGGRGRGPRTDHCPLPLPPPARGGGECSVIDPALCNPRAIAPVPSLLPSSTT